MSATASPGGTALAMAKLGAEFYLWTRVRLQFEVERRLGQARPLPSSVRPTDVLRTVGEYKAAITECRRLRLPLHHDRPKNWDSLGAVSLILRQLGFDARVLDAGAARYSSILPWLYLYGARDLVGNNLEFTRRRRHGSVIYEHGDITSMSYSDGSFDAVTCMSVIEHGVPVEAFTSEVARVLRPGGLLVLSTDYDKDPPDTTGLTAYGSPVKILGPSDIHHLVSSAAHCGLALSGELHLEHSVRPLHWKRTNLNFTFIRLAFVRQ
jgi:SAM-dependent methyltransferase